jgi:REP element-mobilizing transposase RayT
MDAHRSVTGTVGDRKYHAVFILKSRRKAIHVELHCHMSTAFRNLAAQKERRAEEGI